MGVASQKPIIGSGRDSCVLHYIDNNGKNVRMETFLLMDISGGTNYQVMGTQLWRSLCINSGTI